MVHLRSALLTGALFVLIALVVAGEAEATHYRWGILSWEPTGGPNEVRFTGNHGWRRSAFGDPNVGDLVQTGSLATGDGGYVSLLTKVTTVNAANDYFLGQFVDAAGNPGVTHTYPAPDNGGAPWVASWESCCRISPFWSGNYHVNNPDGNMRLETLVDLSPENAAPKTLLPPMYQCEYGLVCTIPVPVADADGDALSFRLATAFEATGGPGFVHPGPPNAPNAASIDAATGVLTWDTAGATYDAAYRTFYSTQLVVEDGRTKTPIDFFIELVPPGTVPPHWVEPPTPCGATIQQDAGTTFLFDVVAASDDALRTVRVDHLGLPPGASFPLPAPANPASGVFTWATTQDDAGSHLVVFTAEDDRGYSAPACVVTLVVVPHPPPEFTAPPQCATGEAVALMEGVPWTVAVTAASPNATRAVALDLLVAPAGLAFVADPPANPVSGVASWEYPEPGVHAVRFRATDDHGISETCDLALDVARQDLQASARNLWLGSSAPLAAEYEGTIAEAFGSASDGPHRAATVTSADLYAQGLETAVAGLRRGPVTYANATTEAAEVSLLGGLVVLEGLQQSASLTWDGAAAAPTLVTNPTIARVLVAGQEVPVLAGAPIDVPVPGGRLVLFEQELVTREGSATYRENLAHLYYAAPYGRAEAIVGSVILQAGVGLDYAPLARDILLADDARTGDDLADTPADAATWTSGVWDGRFDPPGDVDVFAFTVAHGEKVQATLDSGTRATAGRGAVHVVLAPPTVVPPATQTPATGASLGVGRLLLIDPTGAVRDTDIEILGAAPAHVELNADLPGTWHVVLSGSGNWSLAASVTPVPLLPQEADGLSLADAPDACAPGDPSIPTVSSGLWPGVLRDDDFVDVYRFTANLGELVAVALKPGEDVEGFDARLELRDRSCALLGSSDLQLAGVKGVPEVTQSLPAMYTGDFYAVVHRENGVGNTYLAVSVVNPQPTLPANDAASGADAPTPGEGAMVPLLPVFQGRIDDGDAGDAYAFTLAAGQRAEFAFSMSALSFVDVRLVGTGPGGPFAVPPTFLVSGQAVWDFEPPFAGVYTLEVRQVGTAGGNYLVAHGQSPVAG